MNTFEKKYAKNHIYFVGGKLQPQRSFGAFAGRQIVHDLCRVARQSSRHDRVEICYSNMANAKVVVAGET